MSDFSVDPTIVSLEPATAAVVRERVPMTALTEFFGRVFPATMAAAHAQGVELSGPPIAIYYGMPTDTVDVAGGFPTAGPVAADAGITNADLPGGRAVQVLHLGPYDTLERTYARLMSWFTEQGLTPGEIMWESYLNDPEESEVAETLIVWPLTD